MKKVLIFGDEIHKERYKNVLMFRNDIEIYDDIKSNINFYDIIIYTKPFGFDNEIRNKLKDYKNILILEKIQIKLDLIEQLNCKKYYVHLRDFSNNRKYNIRNYNKIIWPNLNNDNMDSIMNTLPNILDVLYQKEYEINTVKVKIKTRKKILLSIKTNKNKFNILIHDTNNENIKPTLNKIIMEWPNYYDSINKFFDFIILDKLDYSESLRREEKYNKIIDKVRKENEFIRNEI